MTAREISERAACVALDLARRAGIRPDAWRRMVHRGTQIKTVQSPERAERFIDALDQWIKQLQDLRRDLKKL